MVGLLQPGIAEALKKNQLVTNINLENNTIVPEVLRPFTVAPMLVCAELF